MTVPHATDPATEPTRPDYEATVLAVRDRARAAGVPSGEEIDRRRQQREQEQRETERRAVVRENVQHALGQVPARYDGARADHPEVRAWVDDLAAGRSPDSLVILGNVGTGKTHQAYGAFAEVAVRTGRRSVAVAVPALLDGLRPGRPGHVDYDSVERAGLLLLDDLAAERSSDWTGETLYRLIDYRWANLLPTIITTNATPAEVRERMGDRVASRLNGMGRVVRMTGEDRRGSRSPARRATD